MWIPCSLVTTTHLLVALKAAAEVGVEVSALEACFGD
jgi:hypothetical protein